MFTKVKFLFLKAICLAILICPISLLAAEKLDAKESNDSLKTLEQSKHFHYILAELTQKNRILEAQLQTTKDYQGSLLDTVYWALAGVFVIVGLLLGFGWLANFKIYDRDKEVIREQLNIQIEIEASNLKDYIKSQIKELSGTQSKLIEEHIDQSVRTLTLKNVSLDSRIFHIELNIKKKEMDHEKSPAMALTHALNVVNLCVKNSQDDIPDTLHFMLNKIDEGGKFTASEITRVQKIINELPTQYSTLSQKLLSKLVASDIF